MRVAVRWVVSLYNYCRTALVFNRTIFLSRAVSDHMTEQSAERDETRPSPCTSWLSIPKFLVLWSQDAFGVTSDRESRNCHDSMDEITGVAYQNRQVEWRLPLVNER